MLLVSHAMKLLPCVGALIEGLAPSVWAYSWTCHWLASFTRFHVQCVPQGHEQQHNVHAPLLLLAACCLLLAACLFVCRLQVYTLFAILFLAFVLLALVTSFVVIALTYFQLVVEDYRWCVGCRCALGFPYS